MRTITMPECVLCHWFATLCDDDVKHPLEALHDACAEVHPCYGLSSGPSPLRLDFAEMGDLYWPTPTYVLWFGAYGTAYVVTRATGLDAAL